MKKKIIIPENIGDITLGQYQKYHELEKKDLSNYDFNIRKIEIFTSLIRSEIELISQKDFNYLIEKIDLSLNNAGDFKRVFKMHGVEFGMIPNFDKITSKEFMDMSSYGTEVENLHRVMAVLYRPIKSKGVNKTYDLISYNGTDEYADVMKLMPLSYVNGSLAFFLNLQNELRECLVRYTKTDQVKGLHHQAILKSGVGMRLLTSWLKARFGSTIIF